MSSVTEQRDEVDVKEIKVLDDEIKLLDQNIQQYDGAFRNQLNISNKQLIKYQIKIWL